MNLIKDPWIWIQRRNGTRQKISPIQITSQYESNPVIRVDYVRPDFSAMITQFFIGLIQTFFAPANNKKWVELLKKPLSDKELLSKIKVSAFDLDGKGPRFMQDFTPEELINDYKVSSLLFESPGEVTIKDKRDFFQPDGAVKTLCPSCAAAALYSKQINNTMKGLGWVTSIRSGSMAPLTTLVVGETLWETILYNILDKKDIYSIGGNPKGAIFSWYEKTVNSEKSTVSLKDKHPYYLFWEMPCRYRLIFEETEDICDICGEHDRKMIKRVQGKNYGNKYTDIRHTLSPYQVSTKKDFVFNCCHFSFFNVDFPSFIRSLIPTTMGKSIKKYPAKAVSNFLTKRKIRKARLWMFGYILDKAKYYGWAERTLFIPEIDGKNDLITTMMDIACNIGWQTELYVKKMLLSRNDLKDKRMTIVQEEFFIEMEPYFYSILKNSDLSAWLDILVSKAFTVFDKYVGNHKIGLQIFFKDKIIKEINKKFAKKLNLPLLDRNIYIKQKFKSIKVPKYFNKEINTMILSWWKGQEINRKKHAFFSRSVSCEDVLYETSFKDFMNNFIEHYDLNGIPEAVLMRRLAMGMIILSKITEIDLKASFPVQVAKSQLNDRHMRELLRVHDVLKDWKIFLRIAKQLEGVNIINFLEGFVNWSPDIIKYWKREYEINKSF